jgi:molybdenum cofactor cytidylyltransferase
LIRSAVIIPAAGNSGRMGTDKALLALPGGLNMAEHLVKGYNLFGASPVILIVNRRLDLSKLKDGNAIHVVNGHVSLGRSWSIQLGIRYVPEGYSCFVQNADNPYIENVLLERLLAANEQDGYAVPVCEGKGGHPVLLGSKIVDRLRNQEELMDFKDVLKRFNRIEVPFADERILWNINSPEDYRKVIQSF